MIVPPGHTATPPEREAADVAPPDAAAGSWVDVLPLRARPYARLARFDRPTGTWLLFWPCAWGTALAGGLPGDIYLLMLFFLGALAMRGAGCVYNDIIDRDLDARVARTRDRPLASGRVSLRAAWSWLIALSLVGLVVLAQLRPLAQLVAVASLALVACYPFMKRISWWPQAWLGLTFNWGALVSWAAVTDSLTAPAMLLYGAGVLWTLGYDTIYALQDIEDDAVAGIRSTARRLSGRLKLWIGLFYGGCTVLLAAALATRAGDPLAAAAALPAALHFSWQVRRLRPGRPDLALALFRSNTRAGALAFAACLVAGWR